MKAQLLRFVLAALSITLLGAMPIFSQKATVNMAADEAAIRQIVQTLEDGWNAHDGAKFGSPFAANADYVIVNGSHVRGKAAIEKGHVDLFTGPYKESKNLAAIKSIRFIRPDVAVVHVEWNMRIKPDLPVHRAMNSLIVTKDAGKWTIAAFHNTPVQAFDVNAR